MAKKACSKVTERQIQAKMLSLVRSTRYLTTIREDMGSVKRVNRHMKAMGLVSVHTKRFKVITTDSKPKLVVSDNTLNHNFSPSEPNQVWTTDVKYIKTQSGWL